MEFAGEDFLTEEPGRCIVDLVPSGARGAGMVPYRLCDVAGVSDGFSSAASSPSLAVASGAFGASSLTAAPKWLCRFRRKSGGVTQQKRPEKSGLVANGGGGAPWPAEPLTLTSAWSTAMRPRPGVCLAEGISSETRFARSSSSFHENSG